MYNCLQKKSAKLLKKRPPHRLLASIFVFVMILTGAQAAEYYWIGGGADNNWSTLANWTTALDGTGSTPAAAPGAGDTAYITGNVTINDARALGSIYVRDNTTITVNAAVTATFLSMEPTGQAYVGDNFTVTITGSGSLTVDNGGGDNSNAIVLSRWSSNDGKIGTLEIDTTVECKQRIETHSGTQLLVNSGKTLKTKNLIHKATGNTPKTQININGNLEVSTTLDLGEIQGSAELNNSGTIITNTITSTNAAYNNTDSEYLINNTGTIKVSSSFTIPAFTNTSDFTPYKGTGSIVLNGTNASFTNNDDVDISITTLQGLQSSVVSGGGHTTIVTADFDAAVQLNGTTITTADFAGAAQLGNTASNTIENATFHGNITLDGVNTFKNFTAAALGNHTLTVNAVQTIQNGGSVSLSGSDDSHRLIVTGNDTGNFALGSIMLNGNYLSLDTASNVVSSLDGTAFAQNTVTTGGSSNWIVTAAAEHVWNGDTDGSWDDESNWLPPSVPTASDDVIINTGSPKITTAALVRNITINGASSINIASGSLTLNPSTIYELDDKISGNGTLILASGKTFSISSSKSFNVNVENNGTLNASGAVTFNKDYTNKRTATFTGGLSVSGNFTDFGTAFSGNITLNGTGTQNFKGGTATPGYDVIINKSNGSVEFTNALTLNSLDTSTNSYTGNITFNGTGTQTITPQSGIYKSITVNKTSGTLTVNGDLQTESLTLSAGAVSFGGNLTLWDGTNYSDANFTTTSDINFTGGTSSSPRTLKAKSITTAGSIICSDGATAGSGNSCLKLQTTNGNISIGSNIGDPSNYYNTVVLDSGTKDITITGKIYTSDISVTCNNVDFSNSIYTGNVSITAANTLSIKNELEAATLTIDPGAQTIKMGGTIKLTDSSQDFVIDYPLLLTANTTFEIAGNIVIKDSASKVGSINSETDTACSLSLQTTGSGKKIQIQNLTSEGAGLGTTKSLSTITINSSLDITANTTFKTSAEDGTIFAGTTSCTTSGSGKLTLTGNMQNTGNWTYGTQLAITGNLINNGTAEFNKQVAVTGNITNNNGKNITFNDDVSATGNVIDNGTWTHLTGKKLTFNGIGAQSFTVNASSSYTDVVVDKESGTFALSAKLNAVNFTAEKPITFNGNIEIETSGDVIFKKPVTSTTNLSIKANELKFQDEANVNNITMDATATTSSDITVTGNWTNNKASGGFTASDGTVTLTPESTSVSISGNNTFKNFTAPNLGGKTITFEAGKTQTVNGTLTLSGSSASSLLRLENEGADIWTLTCTNPTISYVDVINSTSTNSIFAIDSNDRGHNTNWNFPGEDYEWTGADSTNPTRWDVAANWNPASVPGIGAKVTILENSSTPASYPKLIAPLDITNATYSGTITVAANAQFDLADQSLTVGTITNNGLVHLIGASGQTISGKMKNEAGSTVEYYGTGTTPTNFAWDGDNGTNTPGKQYANLILNQNTLGSDILVISANLTINKPATLSGNVTVGGNLTITEAAELSGAVSVAGTTTISAGTRKSVSLDNASNNFTGAVIAGSSTGTSFVAGAVTLRAGSLISIADNANADCLTLNSAVILQKVTTSEDQTYNGAITVNGTTKLITTDTYKHIYFNNDVSGTGTLSAQATNIIINCDKIKTTGNQTYMGAVILDKNTELTSTDDGISFISTIDGTHSLKLTSDSGTTFGGIVGASSSLTSLEVNGRATINCESITTTGIQNYKNPVILDKNTELTSTTGDINFISTVDGSHSLKLTSDSGTTFREEVGSTSSLTSLEVNGLATINCNSITTTGTQNYKDPVILDKNTELTSTDDGISFISTIDGAHSLKLTSDSGTTFGGIVGASSSLTSLEVNGLAIINCESITTTGTQDYIDSVSLDSNSVLTSSEDNITLHSTLDGNNTITLTVPSNKSFNVMGEIGKTIPPSITINQAGNTTFNDTIILNKLEDAVSHAGSITFKKGGTILSATQLHTTGDITLTGTLETLSLQLNNLFIDGTAEIKTTGTQLYNGTINGKVTLPDFDDNLELDSGTSSITFGGNIGQITKLKTLAVTGPAQINKNITITTDDLTFYTGLKSTTESASTLILSNCNTLTNPIEASTVTNIDFNITGESGSTTNFIPGNSEYENITTDTITLNFGDNAFKQKQNASFTINSGSVTIKDKGFNIGNLIVVGGSFIQTGISADSVNDLKLTSGSITWDATSNGGRLAINGTVSEGAGLHINYNKKNITLSKDNTISGVFWNLTIANGITITNGGSIRVRKNFNVAGHYLHNNKELILGLDKTNPAIDTTEAGEVSNTNSTLNNLGKVFINKSSSYSQTISSDLLFTDLEITSGSLIVPASKTITSSNLKNNAACTISNTGTIKITKDFIDQGTYSGTGLLQFSGSSTQTFTPGTSTYKNIENISENLLTISGEIKAENFTISSAHKTSFASTSQITNMTISSASETTFADTANITNFTDTAVSGKINFKNSGNIETATEFLTTDIVTIGDTADDEMAFGTAGSKVDFTHIAGPTTITGKLHAKAITLGDTNTALTRIISGTINAESLTTGNLEAEGHITTTDYQQYDGTVELTNDLALKSDNSTITFDSTITGANALSADSSTDTSFGADAGTSTTKLTSLTITGPATIGSSNIFTSGPQSFSGAVTLTTTPTPHTLTAETITFDAASTIDGDSDLALVTSAGTSFGAKVGSNTSLSSLEVTGPATVACTEITTSGNQHYKNKNAIIFTSDSHLTSTSGNLTFDSTIDGEHLLTLSVPDGTTNTITVAGKVGDTNIPSVTIAQAGNVSFSESVKANAFEIKQAANTTFDDLVTISSFTDEATAGNITFNAGGSISDPTGTVFLTSGILTLGDTAEDIMTFGSDETFADLIHIDGETSITGTLNTANLTLADTQGGPMKINNSGLFKTLDGNSLTYTSSFEQLGEGNTVLGGNFTGNGSASFATNLQLYGSAQADFGTSGKNISVGQNLIINRDTTDNLTIKSNLSIEENLVLYNSPVIANADISAGQDIVILGSGYSETDTSTGITNEYAYKTPRHSDWSQPNYEETTLPDGSDVPDAPNYSAILLVSAGKEISARINFYANGTELSTNGTSGQWNLKLPDLTNPANGFAEAYHSVVSGCKVICNDGTEDGTKSRLAALEWTDSGEGTSTPNTNVELEDFQITKAYTVRDNAIRVEFNQPIRYHASTINQLNFHDANDSVTSATRFTGFYSDPDCQHELTSDITQSYTDEASGKTYWYFYIKAAPQDSASTGAWNTDATGKSSGAANGKSSDRNGIHHTALPCLDFPRALSGNGTTTNLSFIITDIWGKRLNNYSRRVPKGTTAEAAYGSANSSDASFIVADNTGPVMWTVRTGQEMHTAYSAAAGEAGQHSYDAHNFLEFRYSEPVEFTPLDPAVTENIQVTDTFGAIKEDDIRQEASSLTFAGIASLSAASGSTSGRTLQLYTGKNGSPDKYVNALYRTDEYSLRLSIAGWTDGTVSDYSGNTYKNWTGYIEHASQFTRATAAPVTTATTPNDLIKDLAGNSQIEYAVNKIEPTVYSDSTSENPSALLPTTPDLYSLWDISEPVFTPLRFSAETEWGNEDFSEAIGNTNGSGSTLDRIDFHFFDNTPTYGSSDQAEWFTETGWCTSGSKGTKDYLYDKNYTYAADIIGGARQFDPISESDTVNYRRTSGGIRLSTKLGAANGFKYSTDIYETNPATQFASGIENIHSTVISQLFTGSSEPQHAANDPDGLYLGIGITDTALQVETSFAFKYDDSMAYLTDLAGNRLRSKTSKTIDRTPPSFDIILSPVNQNKIYIVFVKKIVTDSNKIDYRDPETGKEYNVAEKPTTVNFLEMLPSCFRIISINSDGSYSESTDLQIDTDIPATIVERYSDNHFTCICLTLNKIITTENVKNLYLQLSYHPDYYHPVYKETSPDPWTSNNNARVTFIQDELGNYMQMYSAHALSDFAIGLVNPLYAYSSDITENDEPVMSGLYNEGSWAVHDWNAEQKNYGTLPAAHSAAIVTQQIDGTDDGSELPENVRIYLSNSPDKGSVSTQFNKDFGTSLRVWLPDLTDGIFRALSAKNNSNWSFLDSEPLEEGNFNNLIFNIPLEMINTWKSGDQISFMFGITESDGSPVKIYNSPYYDTELKRYDFALSTAVPLYALRMHDVTDIGSLDLWSFRLKGITTQRGGVTILNNVINVSNGEKTVLKVDVPTEGRLNVMVMTLDGNIITYLHRGNAKAGENYFTWDGKNRNGNLVARGMYFIRVTGADFDETRKVMVVK